MKKPTPRPTPKPRPLTVEDHSAIRVPDHIALSPETRRTLAEFMWLFPAAAEDIVNGIVLDEVRSAIACANHSEGGNTGDVYAGTCAQAIRAFRARIALEHHVREVIHPQH